MILNISYSGTNDDLQDSVLCFDLPYDFIIIAPDTVKTEIENSRKKHYFHNNSYVIIYHNTELLILIFYNICCCIWLISSSFSCSATSLSYKLALWLSKVLVCSFTFSVILILVLNMQREQHRTKLRSMIRFQKCIKIIGST